MEMNIGDICDKWTIVRMKYRITRSPQMRITLDSLEDEVMRAWEQSEKLGQWSSFGHALFTLIEINAQMWELEASLADLRGQREIDQSLVGKVALEITNKNKIRVKAIKTLNDILPL